MSHIKEVFTLVATVVLGLQGGAMAAGIDCKRAANAVDLAICGNEDLRGLDAELADEYAWLVKAAPLKRAALLEKQNRWLKERNACDNRVSCLQRAYESRISELRSKPRLKPLSKRHNKFDDVDFQALDMLHQAIEQARKIDAEFPLENALERFAITSGMTTFENEECGKRQRLPLVRPKGVNPSEWKALTNDRIDGGDEAEFGRASYTLLDLDGDGQRDLIIDSYLGGTGLFNHTSVLRRNGAYFEGAYRSEDQEDDSLGSSLYDIVGRGANESAVWIRIAGRVYAAHVSGRYGLDEVSLLRPFYVGKDSLELTVLYRYQFQVPIKGKDEEGKPWAISPAWHAALTKALRDVPSEIRPSETRNEVPLCPPPANADEDSRLEYFSFGPAHYQVEAVADVAVWMEGQCHLGQVVNWYGSYAPKVGLSAEFYVRKPKEDDRQQFELSGKRRAIHVDSAVVSPRAQ